jgi:hypothetical protein
MSYLHINNLYKSTDILSFKEVYCLEKIHGTSTHISWKDSEIKFFSGGEKYENFVKLFNIDVLTQKFTEIFGNTNVIVYGEGYGGKQQGMSGTYGKELKFIAFDVVVNDSWLNVPNAEDVAHKLGLEYVHYVQIPTTIEAIDAQRDADSVQAIRNGIGPGKMREGVILRPLIELTDSRGNRIITKHKRPEFTERQNEPKVVDDAKLEILKNAQAIADEWVTPMRLNHVLQGFPQDVGMESTQKVIKAMIEDVYREGKDEIVESKEASSAIGKATAKLLKAHLENKLYN